MDERAEIQIGARIDEAVAAIKEMGSRLDHLKGHAENAGKGMQHLKEHSENANGVLGHLRAQIMTTGGQLEHLNLRLKETGNLFSKFGEIFVAGFAVDKLYEMTRAVAENADHLLKLREMTGMSAESLQGWQFAAKMAGVSAESLERGMRRLATGLLTAQVEASQSTNTVNIALQQLGLNAKQLGSMGLDKALDQIADRFKNLKDGQEKLAAAGALFGTRFGAQLIPLLNKGSGAIDELKKRAAELGVVLDTQSLESLGQVDDAMKEFSASGQAAKNLLATSLAPILTTVANGFVDLGTELNKDTEGMLSISDIIRGVVGGFVGFFIAIGNGVMQVLALVNAAVNQVAGAVIMIGHIMERAMHLDWGGVKNAWKDGTQYMMDAGGDALNAMTKDAEKTKEMLSSLFLGAKPEIKGGGEGGNREDVPGVQGQTRLAEWKAELDKKRDAEGVFQSMSKKTEVEFWEAKLALAKKGTKEYEQVFHEMVAAKKAAAQQEMSTALATLSAEMEAAKNNEAEQKGIMQARVAMLKAAYGEDSQQYQTAIRQKEALDREWETKHKQIQETALETDEKHSLNAIEIAKNYYKTMEEMGAIDPATAADAYRSLANEKLKIEEDYLKRKLELQKQYGDDPASIAKTQAEMTAAYDAHAKDLSTINNELAKNTQKKWEQFFQPLNSAFETSVKGMIMGTQTLQGALANIYNAIVSEFVSMGVKMLTKWIATEIAKTAATQAGVATRTAAQEAGNREGLISQGMTLVKAIMSDAAKTFSGVWAALSGIPVIGPALAAVSAPAAAATVAGMAGSVASAAGGWWEVPSDQMAAIHKKEMVLPEREATAVRQMAEGGGGGGETHLHFHGPVFDHEGFGKYVVKAIKTQARRGGV